MLVHRYVKILVKPLRYFILGIISIIRETRWVFAHAVDYMNHDCGVVEMNNDDSSQCIFCISQLDGKYSERVQLPAKAKFGVFLSPTLGNTCHTYY